MIKLVINVFDIFFVQQIIIHIMMIIIVVIVVIVTFMNITCAFQNEILLLFQFLQELNVDCFKLLFCALQLLFLLLKHGLNSRNTLLAVNGWISWARAVQILL